MSRRLLWSAVVASALLGGSHNLPAHQPPRSSDSTAITVWRYWERNYGRLVEKVMILNNDDADLTLTLRALPAAASSGDGAGDSVAGPWFIPAKNFSVINEPRFSGGPDDRLQFEDQNSRVLQTLPLHSPLPPDTSFKSGMVTTEGVNGGQGKFDHCWWHHFSTILHTGERDTVFLHVVPMKKPPTVSRDIRLIVVRRDTTSPVHLKLLRLSSEALKPGRIDGGVMYAVPWDDGKEAHPRDYTIIFVVEAPAVDDPMIAEVPIWQQFTPQTGHSLSLPVLALP